MISRAFNALLQSKLRTFPAVLIVGPRQCGKTTFMRDRLRGWRQLDLENSDDLQTLAFDLPGFLQENPRRVAIDETQRLPQLFPALRHAIDRDRRPGRYVLTGSADPRLLKTAGETLTGRIGIIELSPFLLSELRAKPAWRQDRWFWGGFPPVYHLKTAAQRADWLGTYVSTVLEEIVRRAALERPAARPYFWRTQAGAEVDLIMDDGKRRAAFEIKLGAAPPAQALQGLRQCLKDLEMRQGFVIYGGRERLGLGGGISLIPWTEILRPDFVKSIGWA